RAGRETSSRPRSAARDALRGPRRHEAARGPRGRGRAAPPTGPRPRTGLEPASSLHRPSLAHLSTQHLASDVIRQGTRLLLQLRADSLELGGDLGPPLLQDLRRGLLRLLAAAGSGLGGLRARLVALLGRHDPDLRQLLLVVGEVLRGALLHGARLCSGSLGPLLAQGEDP